MTAFVAVVAFAALFVADAAPGPSPKESRLLRVKVGPGAIKLAPKVPSTASGVVHLFHHAAEVADPNWNGHSSESYVANDFAHDDDEPKEVATVEATTSSTGTGTHPHTALNATEIAAEKSARADKLWARALGKGEKETAAEKNARADKLWEKIAERQSTFDSLEGALYTAAKIAAKQTVADQVVADKAAAAAKKAAAAVAAAAERREAAEVKVVEQRDAKATAKAVSEQAAKDKMIAEKRAVAEKVATAAEVKAEIDRAVRVALRAKVAADKVAQGKAAAALRAAQRERAQKMADKRAADAKEAAAQNDAKDAEDAKDAKEAKDKAAAAARQKALDYEREKTRDLHLAVAKAAARRDAQNVLRNTLVKAKLTAKQFKAQRQAMVNSVAAGRPGSFPGQRKMIKFASTSGDVDVSDASEMSWKQMADDMP